MQNGGGGDVRSSQETDATSSPLEIPQIKEKGWLIEDISCACTFLNLAFLGVLRLHDGGSIFKL